MRKLIALLRHERGAAAIEMAIALPVIVVMLWGIFQIGLVFQANAGMQHALGEGARRATLCQNVTAEGICSTPTHEDIKAVMSATTFGTGVGEFTIANIVDGVDYMDLGVTFTMPTNFILFDGPMINLNSTKRVYVARPAVAA